MGASSALVEPSGPSGAYLMMNEKVTTFKLFYFLNYAFAHMYLHMNSGAHRCQKMALGPLELEFWAVVNYLM